MPICLQCNGEREEWIDWAETTAPCMACDGTGQVSEKVYEQQRRANEKARRKQLKHSPYPDTTPRRPSPGYRIQSQSQRHNDWDVVDRIEWTTVRLVHSVDYGLYLVNKMNQEAEPYCEFTPYRLVSPNGRVVHHDGTEGQQAASVITFSMPWER